MNVAHWSIVTLLLVLASCNLAAGSPQPFGCSGNASTCSPDSGVDQ